MPVDYSKFELPHRDDVNIVEIGIDISDVLKINDDVSIQILSMTQIETYLVIFHRFENLISKLMKIKFAGIFRNIQFLFQRALE